MPSKKNARKQRENKTTARDDVDWPAFIASFKQLKEDELQMQSASYKFYRPFNVAFLDECSPGAFWLSQATAARDFPCEIKEYVVNANQDDLLAYFKANNLPLQCFELYH